MEQNCSEENVNAHFLEVGTKRSKTYPKLPKYIYLSVLESIWKAHTQ